MKPKSLSLHAIQFGQQPVLAFGPGGDFMHNLFAMGGKLTEPVQAAAGPQGGIKLGRDMALPSAVQPRVEDGRKQRTPWLLEQFWLGFGIAACIAALVVVGVLTLIGSHVFTESSRSQMFWLGFVTPLILSTLFVLFLANINTPKKTNTPKG